MVTCVTYHGTAGDYGRRLRCRPSWVSAAVQNDPAFDRLAADYIAALDPAAQRAAAGRIQRLLLDETPVITAYFSDWLSITAKNITGVVTTAAGHLFLAQAHRV